MADRARSLLIRFIGDSASLDKEANGVIGRLGKIKTAVGEADGFFGKLKAGGGAALESVGGWGAVAGAGVTAAAAAAAKGLRDFEKLGTEIGKGADATGLSYEAFSRWKEVADDAGVAGAALEGTVGKFNKTIGASPGLLASYGGEIQRAKDGTVDVNETFLNAIDTVNGIENPTKRAEAAAKLFGKGWQEMGELIARGSGPLRANLAAVDDTKVFDQQKVEDARKLRDAFDSVVDAGQSLFLTIGQNLAPIISELAPRFAETVNQLKPLVKGIAEFESGVLKLAGPITKLTNLIAGPFSSALGKVLGGIGDVVGAVGDFLDTSDDDRILLFSDDVLKAAGAADTMKEAADGGGPSVQELADRIKDAADRAEYYQSRVEAAKGSTDKVKDASDNYADALKRVRDELKEARDAQSELIDEQLSAIDQNYAYMTATIETRGELTAYNEQVKSGKLMGDELTLATESMRQKMVDTAEAFAGASGQAEGTEGYIRALIQSLTDQASSLDPNSPLRIALQGYIGQLKQIPTTVETNFKIKGDSIVVNGRQIAVAERFDGGGVVPGPKGKPRVVIAEGGETILPTHKGPVTFGTADDEPAAPFVVNVGINAPIYGVDQFERAITDGVTAALAARDRQQRGNR